MKRLLIVEDEPALRDVYTTLFRMQDFEVYEAENGKEGLEQMKVVKPDIVILDALMPVMGGIEFLQAVDLKKNYPDTRVLLLSNLSVPKTVSTGKKLGVHKYMLKASVSPSELVAAVNELAES
jgi:DNA-binding NarL/FixJ family response regulator